MKLKLLEVKLKLLKKHLVPPCPYVTWDVESVVYLN